MRPAAVLLALAAAAPAADPPVPPGNYLLAVHYRSTTALPLAVVRVTDDDGRPAVELLDGKDVTANRAGLRGPRLTVEFAFRSGPTPFVGTIDPKEPGRVLGSLGDDVAANPASLTRTDAETVAAAKPTLPPSPAELAEARDLLAAPKKLYELGVRARDPEQKAKLLADAAAATKLADEKAPALLRKVIAAHPGTPAAADAAADLLTRLHRANPTADEALAWATAAAAEAGRYGVRVERVELPKIAETLAASDLTAATAAFATQAAAKLSDAPPRVRARLLKVLAAAQEKAGDAAAAASTRAGVEALEVELDREYRAKVPPFPPTRFRGRQTDGANRVAVVELFTGSECPPCVAADAAFDALLKSYRPTDVVLLQYHLHRPGPDPLTNPLTVGRWEAYVERYPDDARGTPTWFVNGRPGPLVSGGLALARGGFQALRATVDPLLETKAAVALDGSAKRDGDAVTATVVATRGPTLPAAARLRLLLVEEGIRFPGGNGVRFHHNVVRGAVGAADGVRVADLPGGRLTATADVAAVRAGLTEYLDGYARDERPFPSPDRPLSLKTLKVVGLVEHPATGEILQALELPVAGR